jgi:CYTH domain-containing protein
MGYEIERKFLVNGDYKSHAFTRFAIKQGYLSISGISVIRVRTKGDKAYITIKSAEMEGMIKRHEWEYEIPVEDAEEMLLLCEDAVIDKTRYLVRAGKHIFEVDEFYGENEGLLIAEVELESEEETFEKPDWLGPEVTGNVRYYNSSLSIQPYKKWNTRFNPLP